MANFIQVVDWLDALVTKLTPQQRRKLLRDVATKLRQQQQQNIRQQQNPDGSAFEPRKTPLRAKSGRIKKQMFTRLRTTRYLKTKVSGDAAAVEFDPKARRIARVHHYGLRDRVSKKGPEINYPKRKLLGVDSNDTKTIEDIILKKLSG